MNIGQAARASGLSAKSIRYYERAGLLGRAERNRAGYRTYETGDLDRLRFVRQARGLGFPVDRVRALLALWQSARPSAEVKRMAEAQVSDLDARIAELQSMRAALHGLAARCPGNAAADCPIIDALRDPPAPSHGP